MTDCLHVAVAAIVNEQDEVLVSLRPDHVHQGGLWEFPGGKLEANETVQDALQREIHEELGIGIVRQRPLIQVPHHYPEQNVLLDVWKVESFTGQPHGREGQPVEWRAIEALRDADFPLANRPVIRALQLPEKYLITPEPADDFIAHLQVCLDNGIRLVQLRAKELDTQGYISLAQQAAARCHAVGAKLLLNADPGLVAQVNADGVHLDSRRLQQTDRRPLSEGLLVAASCHTREELDRAQQIGADFALLSPVLPTASHPGTPALGWEAFADCVAQVALPVYALGGMQPAHCAAAITNGAQGIAAIRALWDAV